MTKSQDVNKCKMKKSLFSLFLLINFFYFSCNKKTNKDILLGNWKFDSIYSTDSIGNIQEFENSDSFNLNSDGHFDYSIKKLSLEKKGKWDLQKDSLFLHYTNPDTTRVFIIEILSSNILLLKEGNKSFKYKR